MPELIDENKAAVLPSAIMEGEIRLRADFEAVWLECGGRPTLICDDAGEYQPDAERLFWMYCVGRLQEASLVDPCLAKRLPGEPIFVLLGRDRATPVAIRHWCNEREWHIANGFIRDTPEERAHIAEARKIMAAAIAWEEANPGASRSYRARAAA